MRLTCSGQHQIPGIIAIAASKSDARLIKRTRDAKRHARVIRELLVARRTILNSATLAVYGEAALLYHLPRVKRQS